MHTIVATRDGYNLLIFIRFLFQLKLLINTGKICIDKYVIVLFLFKIVKAADLEYKKYF